VRVALDMTPAVVAAGGVARYATALQQALLARSDVQVRSFAVGRGTGRPTNTRRIPVPARVMQFAWRAWGRPRAESLVGGADVVHSVDLLPPPTRCPLVMTIHDVLPLTHPQFFPDRSVRQAQDQLAAVDRARVVVTTCRATAADIAALGVPPEKTVVARPGWDRRPPAPPDAGPGGPYVLAVGAVTPRKGLEVLARASASLGGDCPPVLVAGPDWWAADSVRAEVAAAGAGVRFLGAVGDGALEALYERATIFCLPSHAEGFGLTCLEAMGHGLPVVASDLPSVREIGADSILLVPHGDHRALADAIAGLLADKERRRALGAAARARAERFSWAAMAEDVVKAYETAMA
jgi:glycosyltransferase involved in cell wall biosynthesis